MIKALVIVSAAFILCFETIQADIIAIFVCDTIASNIEEAVKKDLDNMREEACRISLFTGEDLKEMIFEGIGLCPKKFLAAIRGLASTKDDTVIFFFSGHGYRTRSKDKKNPWPFLYFSESGQGVDYDQVVKMLVSKNHRLLLAIADCCNNYIEDHAAPPVVRKAVSRDSQERIRNNYQKLFLHTSGEIIATSSDISEYSWCTSSGALFASAFLEALQDESELRIDPSWEQIFDQASLKVLKYQTPVVEMSTY